MKDDITAKRFVNHCILIPFAFILVVITGCSSSTGNDDTVNTGNPGTHAYFPMKTGATWTYDPAGEDTHDLHSYTDTIVGTIVHGGKTYWVAERRPLLNQQNIIPDTSLVRVGGNSVYTFLYANELFFKPVLKSAKVGAWPYDEVTVLKFGILPGTSWTEFSHPYSGGNTTAIVTYVGNEDVTVPAGAFQNCIKIRTKTLDTHNHDLSASISTSIVTMWFAQNVGVVKRMVEFQEYRMVPDSVMDYTQIHVLKNYTIP